MKPRKKRYNSLITASAAWLTVGVSTVGAEEHEELPHAFDAGWQGRQTCELLFEDEKVRVARCVFPPGVGHEKHYHNPHFGYTLEGSTLLIQDASGENEVVTEAGMTWSTDSITVHQALNIGDTTTSYLMVEPKSP